MRVVGGPNSGVANTELKVIIAYVAHRHFDRGCPSAIPTHRVRSAGVSTPCTPHHGHAISTSTSPTSPVRRLRPCASQRSSRSQTSGAQLRALTTRHSVWNACAHAHALIPHVPSLEGC